MGYTGQRPSAIPLTTADIVDGTISNADLAGSITSAKITSLDATKLTGTVAPARMGSGTASSTTVLYGDGTYKAEPVTDTTSIKNDISLLALQTAMNGNMSAFGLKNSWIEQFENSTYIEALTQVTRDTSSEFIGTISTTVNSPITITASHQHVGTTAGPAGNATSSAAFDGNTSVDGSNINASEAIVAIDWTSGVTKKLDGFKASSVHANGLNWGGSTVTIYVEGSTDNFSSSIVSLGNTGSVSDTPYVEKLTGITSTTGYRYHRLRWATSSDSRCSEVLLYELLDTANATGSFNSTDVVPQDATNKSSIGLVVLYKDQAGTTTFNGANQLVAKVRANTGQAYQEVVLAGAGTYSDGLKIAVAPAIAVTAGQALSYEISFAGQSASLETRVHGVAMTY